MRPLPSLAPAAQIAPGEIAVGQLDLEYVIPARLALVTCPDSRSACLSINRDVVVNDPAICVVRIRGVSSDGGGLHMRAVAMIDVVQIAPEGAIPDAAGSAEISVRARRRACYPAGGGDKVAARRGSSSVEGVCRDAEPESTANGDSAQNGAN